MRDTDINLEAEKAHARWRGKFETQPKMDISTRHDLAVTYTPGVAQPCRLIVENPDDVFRYTIKANTVAVVTDGSAVLGLGNIGASASIPVMEGKCVLFKRFGGLDAFPICIDSQDTDQIVDTCIRIAPVFGGINLEDIASPRCFEVESRLIDSLSIPVFHDDQHGTAIVVLSALINAFKIVKKDIYSARIVILGAGAAGIAISRLLLRFGISDIVLCDRGGIIDPRTRDGLNPQKEAIGTLTNPRGISGTLSDALRGADVLIGVSGGDLVSPSMVSSMADDAIVFALANPTPEIFPAEAHAAGARIVATGRSDFPNQVNNVIAFPGIFRGALDSRAKRITDEMKLNAAFALADLVGPAELSEDFIMPDPFDGRVAATVADAVGRAAGR